MPTDVTPRPAPYTYQEQPDGTYAVIASDGSTVTESIGRADAIILCAARNTSTPDRCQVLVFRRQVLPTVDNVTAPFEGRKTAVGKMFVSFCVHDAGHTQRPKLPGLGMFADGHHGDGEEHASGYFPIGPAPHERTAVGRGKKG